MNRKVLIALGVTTLVSPFVLRFFRRMSRRGLSQSTSSGKVSPFLLSFSELKQTVLEKINSEYNKPDSVIVFMGIERATDTSEPHSSEGENTVRVMLLQNLEKKITAQTHKANPFLPPFQTGIFITDLGSTHRLIFNKFMVTREHVLVITQDFEAQTQSLTEADLGYSYLVASSIDGFVFFNSDRRAGASMPHKHLQVVPYKRFKMPYLQKLLEVIERSQVLSEKNQLNKLNCVYLTFPFFEAYKHVLLKFRPMNETTDTLESYSAYLKTVYEDARERLGCAKINHSFNLIFGTNWMLLVLRKNERTLAETSVNALGSLGSILTSRLDRYELLTAKKPSEIYSQIFVEKEDSNFYLVE